jgi:hypothetical protein
MYKKFGEFNKPLNEAKETENPLAEAYFPPHGADAPDVKNAKKTLANLLNNLKGVYKVNNSTLDLLSDAIDEYAEAYAEERIDDYIDEKNI